MSGDKPNKTHRFLSMFVDWKKVATTLLLGGVTVIYSGAGWVWHQFTEHQTQIQDLTNELKLYQANVLPEQQELVRRNLVLEQKLDELTLEYRMLRYQVEWHHQPLRRLRLVDEPIPGPETPENPEQPEKPEKPAKAPMDFAEWWEKNKRLVGAKAISPEDIRRFREQAQQIPVIPYGESRK